MKLNTGDHGSYSWLTTDLGMHLFLSLCPSVVLEKYVAITSIDSGCLRLLEYPNTEWVNGWTSTKEVAYSPLVKSIDQLPYQGFDEWYIFDAPKQLGMRYNGNIFESEIQEDRVYVFVNYGSFAMHDPAVKCLNSLFFKQLDLIHPNSYLADGQDWLTFISCNKELFEEVLHRLSSIT